MISHILILTRYIAVISSYFNIRFDTYICVCVQFKCHDLYPFIGIKPESGRGWPKPERADDSFVGGRRPPTRVWRRSRRFFNSCGRLLSLKYLLASVSTIPIFLPRAFVVYWLPSGVKYSRPLAANSLDNFSPLLPGNTWSQRSRNVITYICDFLYYEDCVCLRTW